MLQQSQSTAAAPSSPLLKFQATKQGSEGLISADDHLNLRPTLKSINEGTDRINYFSPPQTSSSALEKKPLHSPDQFSSNNGEGNNEEFLRKPPNIRAEKMDIINQKNGDSGEDIYMGTQAQERFKEKHFTFFQKRLLNTIVSDNEETLTDKRKNTTNGQTVSGNANNNSFNKNTQQNNITKDNIQNTGSKFQNSARSGQNHLSIMNQSLRKSEANKSDALKKKITLKEIGEKMWALKIWYICILASVVGTIICIISFYISNSFSNTNIMSFVIYPISAFFLQSSLIAIQRLMFIKIKVIEQEKKLQASSFNREKVNVKRFYSFKYFYTVYSNVSAKLMFFAIATAFLYGPIVERVILDKIQPTGGIYELDVNGDFVNSYDDRRNYLLIQSFLRILWIYLIGFFNYILLNQEYTRIENLAKTDQNQNAERNQFLGQIYKEFENDLVLMENKMHIGLNQKSVQPRTIGEYIRASIREVGVGQQASNAHATVTDVNNVINVPLTANQLLNQKQSQGNLLVDNKPVDPKSTLQAIPQQTKLALPVSQIDNNDSAINPFSQIIPSEKALKQMQIQKALELKKIQRMQEIRDVLQFWMKIQREDIFAFTQNIFIGFTILLISVPLTQYVLINYLMEESEPAFYITIVLYFLLISIMFFKGTQQILRRQQDICKKIMRTVFFIFASVCEASLHFELSQSIQSAYIISIIKFASVVIFLHIVPWLQQIKLERQVQKQVESAFRQSMQSRTTRKSKNSLIDFRPSHIIDIKDISHLNDEKKVYYQNKLTLIQFLVSFCITDISSSVSFIAISFISKIESIEQLISILHYRSSYSYIYLILAIEIICFLLMIILTIFFFKRTLAKSEYDTLKNYSFINYTQDLIKENITAIVIVYLFTWHFVFLLLNN